MRSAQQVTTTLRGLDPQSDDFHSIAVTYFTKYSRFHRNYGRLFIGLALLSWIVVFAATGRVFVWWEFFSFCFLCVIGWTALSGADSVTRALAEVAPDSDAATRRKILLRVASMHPHDSVSLLILAVAREPAPTRL